MRRQSIGGNGLGYLSPMPPLGQQVYHCHNVVAFIKQWGFLYGFEGKTDEEVFDWYNSLNQARTDAIRGLEKSFYVGNGYALDPTEKQIAFIKNNGGEPLVNRVGGFDKLSRKGASLIIDKIISDKNRQ